MQFQHTSLVFNCLRAHKSNKGHEHTDININIQTCTYMHAGMEIAIHTTQRHERACILTHHLAMMHVMRAGSVLDLCHDSLNTCQTPACT